MKNVEISYLKEKKKAYDDIIGGIETVLKQNDPTTAYYKALTSMIRSLQSQQRIIVFAIKSREAKT